MKKSEDREDSLGGSLALLGDGGGTTVRRVGLVMTTTTASAAKGSRGHVGHDGDSEC